MAFKAKKVEKKAVAVKDDRVLLVVRLKDVHHPGLQRITAYRKFLIEPRVAFVTKAQAKEIKADSYLVIEPRGCERWLKAFGLEFTEINVSAYAEENPPFTHKVLFAEIVPPAPDVANPDQKPDELPLLIGGKKAKTEPVKTEEETNSETRAQVIAELEKRGMTSGVDFQPDAELAALQIMLV